jgi:hypothetical protein
MKKLLFFLSLLTLLTCNERFNAKDYKGTWINIDENQSFSHLPSITFRNDSVFLEDIYTYVTAGRFKIIRNNIFYYLRKDTLKYNFSYNSKDSTIIIAKNKYIFLEEYSYNSSFKVYDLINIRKENVVSSDSIVKFDGGIHLFKDSSGSLKLKLNAKIANSFKMLPRFVLFKDKFDDSFPVIYVGYGVTLKDLIKVYIQLWSVNVKSSMLVLDLDIKRNLYSAYFDEFDFWDEQLALLSNRKIEATEADKNNNRKKYLEKLSPEIIEINTSDDFKKLKDFNKQHHYICKVNKDLSIEDYIALKEKIAERKKENLMIRTEFSDYLISK